MAQATGVVDSARAAPTGVLHLVDSLGLGGAQTILKNYFESRSAHSGRALFALRTAPGSLAIAHPNVTVHPSAARFSLAPLLRIHRLLGEGSFGVLHCHLFRSQASGWLVKALFFPRVALVFHEHGRAVGREGESWLETLAFRIFLRVSRGWVDRYVCISDLTRERLLGLVPAAAERAVVVANPIGNATPPAAGARAAMRAKLGLSEDAFVVGFAARLVERKGWADFLHAVALIPAGARVHFLLAGDGEDRAAAEALVASLGLEARGRLLGHVEAMADFYACLDCFVLPSHWEPHGLSHLEAQAYGVPVVVTRVPGLKSTVNEGVDALLCEPREPAALARAIEALAADAALRARLAAAGRGNAERYSIDSFTRSLDDVHAQARARVAASKAA